MKVSCLKHFLKDLDDNTEVVIPGFDHTFKDANRMEIMEVEKLRTIRNVYSEYDGGPVPEGNTLITVVVIE